MPPSAAPAKQDVPQVDLGRAVLPQVAALGAAYDAWVHDAVSPRAAAEANEGSTVQPARWSGSLRLFETNLMESMSHIPWWLVPVVWVPIVTGLGAYAVLALGHGTLSLVLHALAGFMLWTLVEYVLHRFVFHYKPRSAFGRKVHFLAHGIHHLDPWDPTRLVFPPVAGLIIASGILGVLTLALGWVAAIPVMAGLLVGYMTYDLTHYYTHHGKPKSRWGKFLKAWHLAHHHKHWERMYGVSSPLWDYVFRTGRPPLP